MVKQVGIRATVHIPATDHIRATDHIPATIQVTRMVGISINLELNAELYPQNVIEAVFYRNAASFVGSITDKQDDIFSITLELRENDKSTTEDELRDVFNICLNEESLKAKVSKETNQLRDLILAHAFSKADLTDE